MEKDNLLTGDQKKNEHIFMLIKLFESTNNRLEYNGSHALILDSQQTQIYSSQI